MTAPQPATPGSDSVRAQIAEEIRRRWVLRGDADAAKFADVLVPLVNRLLAEAKAEGEERGYERAQNECPPGGWETGL